MAAAGAVGVLLGEAYKSLKPVKLPEGVVWRIQNRSNETTDHGRTPAELIRCLSRGGGKRRSVGDMQEITGCVNSSLKAKALQQILSYKRSGNPNYSSERVYVVFSDPPDHRDDNFKYAKRMLDLVPEKRDFWVHKVSNKPNERLAIATKDPIKLGARLCPARCSSTHARTARQPTRT